MNDRNSLGVTDIEPDPHERARAARVVAANATDAGELAEMLAMLGLHPSEARLPDTGRENSPADSPASSPANSRDGAPDGSAPPPRPPGTATSPAELRSLLADAGFTATQR